MKFQSDWGNFEENFNIKFKVGTSANMNVTVSFGGHVFKHLVACPIYKVYITQSGNNATNCSYFLHFHSRHYMFRP
jgi:hypothetical protein